MSKSIPFSKSYFSIAQVVIKDRMQGSALLKAKKIICGDGWNKPLTHKTSEKWKSFLQTLGATRSNVDKLLDFAGYNTFLL